MKIRKLTFDEYPKALALLKNVFPNSKYEAQLFEKLHKKERQLHEWIAVHRNRAIGYLAYSNAYFTGDSGKEICGLHLAPLAVVPEMQNQGVGSEMVRFSLRQQAIKEKTLFVLGEPKFYSRFGFNLCDRPICPFDKNNKHFLMLRTEKDLEKDFDFTVGYEPEF